MGDPELTRLRDEIMIVSLDETLYEEYGSFPFRRTDPGSEFYSDELTGVKERFFPEAQKALFFFLSFSPAQQTCLISSVRTLDSHLVFCLLSKPNITDMNSISAMKTPHAELLPSHNDENGCERPNINHESADHKGCQPDNLSINSRWESTKKVS